METRENNFGKRFFIGDRFNLYRTFGKNVPIECYITEISDSGLFFKVNKSDKLFSIKTLHSKGSTITNGYYLVQFAH